MASYQQLQKENQQLRERNALLESLQPPTTANEVKAACDGCATSEGVMLAASMSDPLEDAARLVAGEMSRRPGMAAKAFDPTMIVTLAQALFSILASCREARESPSSLIARSRSPNFRDRLIATRRVKRSMTRKDWNAFGGDVVDSVFAAGADATTNQVAKLMSAIAEDPNADDE